MPEFETQKKSVGIKTKISEDDKTSAEENLRQYLTVVRYVFDHIKKENPKILTDLRRRARLRRQKAHR